MEFELPQAHRLECVSFHATISQRQCLINQVVNGHRLNHPCGTCEAGKVIRTAWPQAYRLIQEEKAGRIYGVDGTPYWPLSHSRGGRKRGRPPGSKTKKEENVDKDATAAVKKAYAPADPPAKKPRIEFAASPPSPPPSCP